MSQTLITNRSMCNMSEFNSSSTNESLLACNESTYASQDAMAIPLYIYITASFINLVIFCFGVFGNALVVVVVIRVKEMRTPVNMFLLSLSAADMLVLLICQPAGLMEFFNKERWYLGGFICKIVRLMEHGVIHVSILTMLAVTAERYSAICHPFKRRMTCTVSTAIKSNIAIWIFAYLLTSPTLLMTSFDDATFYDGSPIKVCRTLVNETWRYTYIVLMFVALFLLPFILLLAMYTQIIRHLVSENVKLTANRDSSAVSTLRSRKQVVRMLILIMVLFFLSLFPIRCFVLWLIFTPPYNIQKIGLEAYLNILSWCRILMYVNSAGNPIIYNLTSTKFKVAFSRVLRGQTNSGRRSNSYTSKYTLAQRLKRVEFHGQDGRQIGRFRRQHDRLNVHHPRLTRLRPREDNCYNPNPLRITGVQCQAGPRPPVLVTDGKTEDHDVISQPLMSDKDSPCIVVRLTLLNNPCGHVECKDIEDHC